MELHHGKHHNTYVVSLNKALAAQAEAIKSGNVHAQIALQSLIRFHGGGHINHSLFWQNLVPASSKDADPESAPKLTDAIIKTWGDLAKFKAIFNDHALGLQGSGWVWLIRDDFAGLKIVTTKDQDPIAGKGETPIVGVDMWEHAYYLQYLNGKADYINNIWNVVNWKVAEKRFVGSAEDLFVQLRAVL
jgi:Fe-Mn family superoxide dismutase